MDSTQDKQQDEKNRQIYSEKVSRERTISEIEHHILSGSDLGSDLDIINEHATEKSLFAKQLDYGNPMPNPENNEDVTKKSTQLTPLKSLVFSIDNASSIEEKLHQLICVMCMTEWRGN